jgi:hypothetical protein
MKTIEAGANAITYTPPPSGDVMGNLMDKIGMDINKHFSNL